MFNTIFKRLFVMAVMAFMIVFLLHETVMAVVLEPLPPIEMGDKGEIGQIDCDKLPQALARLGENIQSNNVKLTDFLNRSSTTYMGWHQQLAIFENVEKLWVDGSFLSAQQSVESLNAADDLVSIQKDYELEALYGVLSVIEAGGCLQNDSDEVREELMAFIERLGVDLTDHMDVSAGFISEMHDNLADVVDQWLQLESQGEAVTLPTGYFSILKQDSEIFSEAARLTAENGDYVLRKYNHLRARLEQLLMPLAPRLESR